MTLFRWIAGKLLRRHRELVCDIPRLDEKAAELDHRLHPVAGWTHALEIEAYGTIRPRAKERDMRGAS